MANIIMGFLRRSIRASGGMVCDHRAAVFAILARVSAVSRSPVGTHCRS